MPCERSYRSRTAESFFWRTPPRRRSSSATPRDCSFADLWPFELRTLSPVCIASKGEKLPPGMCKFGTTQEAPFRGSGMNLSLGLGGKKSHPLPQHPPPPPSSPPPYTPDAHTHS